MGLFYIGTKERISTEDRTNIPRTARNGETRSFVTSHKSVEHLCQESCLHATVRSLLWLPSVLLHDNLTVHVVAGHVVAADVVAADMVAGYVVAGHVVDGYVVAGHVVAGYVVASHVAAGYMVAGRVVAGHMVDVKFLSETNTIVFLLKQ